MMQLLTLSYTDALQTLRGPSSAFGRIIMLIMFEFLKVKYNIRTTRDYSELGKGETYPVLLLCGCCL